jgi:hypothetical protein
MVDHNSHLVCSIDFMHNFWLKLAFKIHKQRGILHVENFYLQVVIVWVEKMDDCRPNIFPLAPAHYYDLLSYVLLVCTVHIVHALCKYINVPTVHMSVHTAQRTTPSRSRMIDDRKRFKNYIFIASCMK